MSADASMSSITSSRESSSAWMSSRSIGVTKVRCRRFSSSCASSSQRCSTSLISAAFSQTGCSGASISSSSEAPRRICVAIATKSSKKRSSRGISRQRNRATGPSSAGAHSTSVGAAPPGGLERPRVDLDHQVEAVRDLDARSGELQVQGVHHQAAVGEVARRERTGQRAAQTPAEVPRALGPLGHADDAHGAAVRQVPGLLLDRLAHPSGDAGRGVVGARQPVRGRHEGRRGQRRISAAHTAALRSRRTRSLTPRHRAREHGEPDHRHPVVARGEIGAVQERGRAHVPHRPEEHQEPAMAAVSAEQQMGAAHQRRRRRQQLRPCAATAARAGTGARARGTATRGSARTPRARQSASHHVASLDVAERDEAQAEIGDSSSATGACARRCAGVPRGCAATACPA